MATKSYARIQDGIVAELFETEADIRDLFNPALVWVDVTGRATVPVGWRYDGTAFTAPPPALPISPSLAELEAQLQAVSAQIAALTRG